MNESQEIGVDQCRLLVLTIENYYEHKKRTHITSPFIIVACTRNKFGNITGYFFCHRELNTKMMEFREKTCNLLLMVILTPNRIKIQVMVGSTWKSLICNTLNATL
jgi:hypothetical protein